MGMASSPSKLCQFWNQVRRKNGHENVSGGGLPQQMQIMQTVREFSDEKHCKRSLHTTALDTITVQQAVMHSI